MRSLIRLDSETRAQLSNLIATIGEERAMALFDMSPETAARAAAGLPVRRATVASILHGLGKLA